MKIYSNFYSNDEILSCQIHLETKKLVNSLWLEINLLTDELQNIVAISPYYPYNIVEKLCKALSEFNLAREEIKKCCLVK